MASLHIKTFYVIIIFKNYFLMELHSFSSHKSLLLSCKQYEIYHFYLTLKRYVFYSLPARLHSSVLDCTSSIQFNFSAILVQE